ncbi:hypothetical protein SpCBS45565_g03838 [Spizellomyces sp. 'palustris']|nr:hypothetical protein SpCBS45565_g03838 [Spizellomyces sp. 'palustris']
MAMKAPTYPVVPHNTTIRLG